MIMLWLYLVGWAAAGVYFCVTMQPDAERPSWLTALDILLLALASLWPLVVVFRVAFAVWHYLGHPGAARLIEGMTAKNAPMRTCQHAHPVALGDKYEWCSTCGSVRENPLPWIPCVRQGFGVSSRGAGIPGRRGPEGRAVVKGKEEHV